MASSFFLCCSLLFGVLVYANGLKCMKCQASTFEECDITGMLERCMPNQKSCETSVRREGGHMTVTKRCKDVGACRSNFFQNYGRSGKSTQCNSDQTNSFCTCCCGSDLCNTGRPTCVAHYQNTGPVNDCPQSPAVFPHGNIECHNENKAGSVCEYKCTGKDYSVWPKGRDTNVCRENGSWAFEKPCCARPCPPYFLFDDLFLFHFSGEKAEETFQSLVSNISYGVLAEDGVKIAAMYFSGEPVESSVIKFNEYGSDSKRLQRLTDQRLHRFNDGQVNMGAAIRYALENILTPEAGMRDDRVPKTLSIAIDKTPDDDAKSAAEEARRRGYLVYIMGYENSSYRLDRKKMLEITGDEDHIFIFGGSGSTYLELVDDFMEHFCGNPCEHVMHDHE